MQWCVESGWKVGGEEMSRVETPGTNHSFESEEVVAASREQTVPLAWFRTTLNMITGGGDQREKCM